MTEAIETYVSSAPLSVSSACRTLDIARSTFYRYRGYDPFVDTNVELRDRVQKVALEWPSYGYRRITHELLRKGVDVGLKTILRLMREDNLLCLRKQRFRIATTDSDTAFDKSLALNALTMALRERPFRPGELVHHSDRGSQYASADYTKTLVDNGIAISMSRKGVPQDNASEGYCW